MSTREAPIKHGDVNAVVADLLRDLALAQASPQKRLGYNRAAAAVLALEQPLAALVSADGRLARVPGIGPASTRVIFEVLESGRSPTVEQAVASSGSGAEVDQHRALRRNFLSRAEALRVLGDRRLDGPTSREYRGDLQMHSEWSDGSPTLAEIVDGCLERGYSFAAVTDHAYGLKIAGGMSMAKAADQKRAIAAVNASRHGRFRLIQGIEANIGSDGQLDLSADEAAEFELVLAAPHSQLRKHEDQTERLLAVVNNPRVHVLAHPRGRISGSRAGIAADWDHVFAIAAQRSVAIEIDGDPARQDLDYTLAARALAAGCLFALDSDAHNTAELRYAETALAHARLASIPADRIVNCWPTDRLLAWLDERTLRRTPRAR